MAGSFGHCGFEHTPWGCDRACGIHRKGCHPAPDGATVIQPGVDKPICHPGPSVKYGPFDIWYAEECINCHDLDLADRVDRIVEADTDRLLSVELWTGQQTGNPSLSSLGEVVQQTNALNLPTAIGHLADTWTHAGGVGCPILHIPALALPSMVDRGLIQREGALYRDTAFGWKVAAGWAGNVGPRGAVAPPGTAWVYLSGPVEWNVTPIAPVNTDIGSAEALQNIDFYSRERSAMVRINGCRVFAALVALACDCCDECPVPDVPPIEGDDGCPECPPEGVTTVVEAEAGSFDGTYNVGGTNHTVQAATIGELATNLSAVSGVTFTAASATTLVGAVKAVKQLQIAKTEPVKVPVKEPVREPVAVKEVAAPVTLAPEIRRADIDLETASAAEILGWVDNDVDRAGVALRDEREGKQRKGLTAALKEIVNADG